MKSAYPVAADLTAKLAAGGLTVDATQVGNAVLAGIEAFQRDTGRHMLAGKTVANGVVAAQTRVYPPPDNPMGYLDFGADLASLTSVEFQPEGSSAEAWVSGTDFRLLPLNAAFDGQPYAGMQLARRYWTPRAFSYSAAVEVTGSWGYWTGIPEDAWDAMLVAGVLYLLDNEALATEGLSGSSISWSHEGHSESSSSSTGSSSSISQRAVSWRAQYEMAVSRYRRAEL